MKRKPVLPESSTIGKGGIKLRRHVDQAGNEFTLGETCNSTETQLANTYAVIVPELERVRKRIAMLKSEKQQASAEQLRHDFREEQITKGADNGDWNELIGGFSEGWRTSQAAYVFLQRKIQLKNASSLKVLISRGKKKLRSHG